MPDENEQTALNKIKAYLDAGHDLDAVRSAGWKAWIDHLEASGYDVQSGQLVIQPPDDEPPVAIQPPEDEPSLAIKPPEERPPGTRAGNVEEAAQDGPRQADEMYCENCGSAIKRDVRFCPKCGEAVASAP